MNELSQQGCYDMSTMLCMGLGGSIIVSDRKDLHLR